MAQPLFMKLRQKAPRVPIDVLAPKWVAPLFEFMPEIREVISANLPHGQFRLKYRWKLAKQLKRKHYEHAYILPNSFKSALIPWFADIPVRVGWRGEYRYLVVNKRYAPVSNTPPRLAERFAYLADGQYAKLTEPRLHVDKALQQRVTDRFVSKSCKTPLVLAIGAEYGPAKRWPIEYFAEVARYWIAHRGWVWILGTQSDAGRARTIISSLDKNMRAHCLNLCGRTSLKEAVILLASAHCVLSNDSGLMHVSAALLRPMVALFGSSSVQHTPPLNASAKALHMRLSCAPCFKRVCPLGHHNCLKRMRPELVIQQLLAQ